MDSSDAEVLVDQVSNLSTTKETVLQTDSSCEVRITDDFVQCWSNPRIKYCKIRHWNTPSRWRRSYIIHWINQLHFFDSLHSFRRKLRNCTYLGREPYLPASKGCWWWELVKVEIRNLQSLLVCSIILWRVSTEGNWIFGWRSCLASQILILFWPFTFLHCRWMERLFGRWTPLIQFLRIRCWWWRMWIWKKRFPIYHVSQMLGGPSLRLGDTKERLIIPSGTGWGGNDTGRLVTWEFPPRIDSASWKSLKSFLQLISFYNPFILPVSSKINILVLD